MALSTAASTVRATPSQPSSAGSSRAVRREPITARTRAGMPDESSTNSMPSTAAHQQNRDPGRRSQGKERLEPTTSPQVADVQHDPVLGGQPVVPAQRSFLGLVAGTEPARVDTAPDQLGVNAVSADGRDLP